CHVPLADAVAVGNQQALAVRRKGDRPTKSMRRLVKMELRCAERGCAVEYVFVLVMKVVDVIHKVRFRPEPEWSLDFMPNLPATGFIHAQVWPRRGRE